MLSEKRWRLDALLLLAAGLMFCWSAGALVKTGLDHWLPGRRPGTQAFYTFIVSTISFQGVGLVLVHYFIKLHQMTWRGFLNVPPEGWKRMLRLAIGTALLAIPMTLLLNFASAWLMTALDHAPQEQMVMEVLQQTVGWGQRICFGFAAIVLAPVVEEIIFRGILYTVIKEMGYPGLALAGTSLLFAAIHGSLLTLVPLTFLAMVLAILYEKTDTLVAPILTHALFNAVNFSLFFIVPAKS